jgi:kumamolisin
VTLAVALLGSTAAVSAATRRATSSADASTPSGPDTTGLDTSGLDRIGPADPAEILPLTLLLHFPGTAALEQVVAAQHRAANPQWLTPAQIGAQFGLPSGQLDAAVARLEQAGITVTQRFDQRTAILASGSVRSVERLFHVRLGEYRTSDGTHVIVPSAEPKIPADLADVFTQVDGLDTRPVFHSGTTARRVASQTSTTPGFLDPEQLAHIYDADALTKAGVDGRGETVAVLSLATLHGEEVDKWASYFKTKTAPDDEIVVQPAAPTSDQPSWDANPAIEVALDLEMVRALAPAATILNYSTRNDGSAMDRIVNQVAQDHRASILSMSWGSCELQNGPERLRNSEPSYAAAEASGVDMFASSGDVGPYDCNNQNGDTSDRHLSVDYPASSSYVLGVGGTTLLQNGTRLSESVWQEPQSAIGAGGGISLYLPRPSWQLDSVVRANGTTRVVPDVAGPASDLLNLAIGVWYKDRVVKLVASGTSAAAPFWAGSMALVKQYLRANAGGFPDGSLKTLLYQIGDDPTAYAAAFHDTKEGSNEQYAAAPGWDPITGLGSPDISGLAAQLQTLLRRG